MLVDFGDIARDLAEVVNRYLDHWHLNDTTNLENPTSEELARWIFLKLKPTMPLLVSVKIDETCTSSAEYRPSQP